MEWLLASWAAGYPVWVASSWAGALAEGLVRAVTSWAVVTLWEVEAWGSRRGYSMCSQTSIREE